MAKVKIQKKMGNKRINILSKVEIKIINAFCRLGYWKNE
jgi:hypothetical protein